MIEPNNDGIPKIPVNRPEEPSVRKARPRSHSPGVGGILVALYRQLVLEMTGGAGAGPFLMNKLMTKYLARCAKDDPSFNKTNTRGNMHKELSAQTMTFRSFCRALIFWEFKNMKITFEGERENGEHVKAAISVKFDLPPEDTTQQAPGENTLPVVGDGQNPQQPNGQEGENNNGELREVNRKLY